MTAAGESKGGEVARSAVESVTEDKPGRCSSVYVKYLFSHKELGSASYTMLTTDSEHPDSGCVWVSCFKTVLAN